MVGAWEAGSVYECGLESCYSGNDMASIILSIMQCITLHFVLEFRNQFTIG